MQEAPESVDLKELRALLKTSNIGPEHAVEYWVGEHELEQLKAQIRQATNGNCYFFHRPETDKVHLLAVVGIEGVADIFEKVKAEQSQVSIDHSRLAEGNADTHVEF